MRKNTLNDAWNKLQAKRPNKSDIKNLQLSLIGKWFELTKAGIKTEDYREITPYWCSRFLLYQGFKKKAIWCEKAYSVGGFFSQKHLMIDVDSGRITYVEFDQNTMTLGYPKSTDSDRILKLRHKGIHIGTGNPGWGAIPGKLYFVIKHGEVIK